jgi:hypothetical protein
MPDTLDDKLARIERLDSELLRKFGEMTVKGGPMYISDFILVGAAKRTLALSDGFRGHIREKNFTCAAALLRMQLDTALRLHAATLYSSPQEYAQKIFEGARVDRLKGRDGNKFTDAYLARKLSEEHPWVKKMHDELCEFVHFSNRHYFSAVARTNDETQVVYRQVSAKDPKRPDEDYFEILDAYLETMGITGTIALAWYMANRKIAADQSTSAIE